jgi:hypothetical protein
VRFNELLGRFSVLVPRWTDARNSKTLRNVTTVSERKWWRDEIACCAGLVAKLPREPQRV